MNAFLTNSLSYKNELTLDFFMCRIQIMVTNWTGGDTDSNLLFEAIELALNDMACLLVETGSKL